MNRSLRSLVWLAVLGLAPLPALAAPLAVFEVRDVLDLAWPRTLVTYLIESGAAAAPAADNDSAALSVPDPASPARVRIPQTVKPAELRLLDAEGKEAAFQLWQVRTNAAGELVSARLSFFAELAAGGAFRYELHSGRPAASAETLKVEAAGDTVTLDNGLVAVRLPKLGRQEFAEPLAMGQSHPEMVAAYGAQVAKGVAPGPLQGVRLCDGRWVGGSYFWAEDLAAAPKVAAVDCQVTARGPLFVEATVRYAFTHGGWYQFTARVLAGDPAVRIDEQFDMGEPGGMWSFRLMVSLGAGWQPDTVWWMAPRLKEEDAGFLAKLEALSVKRAPLWSSRRLAFDAPYTKVFDVAVRYPWHPNAYFFGLVADKDLTAEALAAGRLPGLGVVPMHSGNWRGATDSSDGMLFSYAGGDVCLNWRLRASPHPRTSLHTGEYDPALPLSTCRRQWALVGGNFPSYEPLLALRRGEGFITLDDYKDWTLDWPSPTPPTYPRLLFSREDIERLRPTLESLPGAETLKGYLYFNDAEARRKELLGQFRQDSCWSSPYGMARSILRDGDPGEMNWATHFRLAQMAGWAGNLDELLSSPGLAPEDFTRLRTHLAVLCHLMAEPDVNPRGAMTHLGNPNMPINRFCALPWTAALIPDHPLANTWLDDSAKYIRYKLAMNTAPNGTWSELMTYFGASAPHVMQTASVLAAAGRLDEPTARLAAMPAIFTMNLLTPPDPRFAARIVSGWGHEGVDNACHYLVAANIVRRLDPALAAAFVWAWDQTGRTLGAHHDAGFSPRAQVHADLLSSLPDGYVAPQLDSAWLPGFGATMRAFPGHANETYLSLRQGYCVSHCDPNQGDLILYARGAPLVALTLTAYPLHQHPPFQELDQTFGWHTRVRFGKPGNTGGWPGGGAVGGIPAHAFGPLADYARAVGEYGPQRWTRQVVFMKPRTPDGPAYFILRDSFTPLNGDAASLEPAFWSLRNPAPKNTVTLSPNGLAYASPQGASLTVHFLQPESVTGESREATREGPLYFGNARNWIRAGSPTVSSQQPDNATVADTLTVSTFGPIAPGQDILVALLPLGRQETAPAFERLADGVVKVTSSEGVDYVFLSDTALRFAGDDLAFSGLAGAVRIGKGDVSLLCLEGPVEASHQGAVLSAGVPVQKTLTPAEAATKPRIEMPAPPELLNPPPLPDGCRIEGPAWCRLEVTDDRLGGRSGGLGGFLHAPMPPGMKVLPMLVIDGQTYAPGTSGGTLIIPLLPGDHSFTVVPLEQPPVFRNWQAW